MWNPQLDLSIQWLRSIFSYNAWRSCFWRIFWHKFHVSVMQMHRPFERLSDMASDTMTVSYLASANSYGGFSDARAQVYIHPQSDPYFLENLSQMPPGEGFVLPPGSQGHSAGVCRSCAWYWKPKGCWYGRDCAHCHLLHPRTKLKKPRARLPRPELLLNQGPVSVHTDFTTPALDYLAPAWQPGQDLASAAPSWNWQEYDEEIPTQTDLHPGARLFPRLLLKHRSEIPFRRSTGNQQLRIGWPRALVISMPLRVRLMERPSPSPCCACVFKEFDIPGAKKTSSGHGWDQRARLEKRGGLLSSYIEHMAPPISDLQGCLIFQYACSDQYSSTLGL